VTKPKQKAAATARPWSETGHLSPPTLARLPGWTEGGARHAGQGDGMLGICQGKHALQARRRGPEKCVLLSRAGDGTPQPLLHARARAPGVAVFIKCWCERTRKAPEQDPVQ